MSWGLILLLAAIVFCNRYVFLEPRVPVKLPALLEQALQYAAPLPADRDLRRKRLERNCAAQRRGSRCANWPGVMPSARLKWRWKWLWSEKPQALAASGIGQPANNSWRALRSRACTR